MKTVLVLGLDSFGSTLAKSLADETPNVPILIGCEPRHSEEVEPWLSVVREDDETQVEECEETCTP